MGDPELPRDELRAAIAARRETGADLEPELVDGFLARVEQEIDRRVDRRLAERERPAQRAGQPTALAVPLGSVGLAIPLTAIAAGTAGLPGILVVWIGIVLVNVAFAVGRSSR